MSMTPYTGETLTIANIGTTPQERAMETSEFKMAFSKDFHEFVEWFNDTHKTDFDAVQTEITSHKAESATGTQKGHVILASSSETELGTNATKAVTPAGLKEVLDKRPSLIDNRIPVPAGADMNDYITPGNYRILDVATAGTLINYPAPYGGTLEVWRYTPAVFIQRLTTLTTGVFYQRICANGVWSSWNMTYNTTNITVSTSAPSSALAEGFQHQVY